MQVVYSLSKSMINYTALVSTVKPVPDGLVSYEAREIVVTSNIFFGEIVGLLGIVANAVNVIVFSRMGFSDTVNISLTALAVSDIGALVTLQWLNVIVNPWFISLNLPFLPLEIQSLTAGYPHNYFIKVTGFITAFVAFERCLCVTVPFKVRRLITKNMALVFNVTVFFVIAFSVIIISNLTIAIKLKKAAAWRQTSSGAEMPMREKKMVKMIATVSLIFMTCFIPTSALLSARAIVPELSINGVYSNINWIVAFFGLQMETVNSSITIVVYYRMSAKYRDTLLHLFGVRRTAVQKQAEKNTVDVVVNAVRPIVN